MPHTTSEDGGSPRELVKQLSVIYPCGNGQMSEAGRVAPGKGILGLFTPSYGRFWFTKWRGEPGWGTHVGHNFDGCNSRSLGCHVPLTSVEHSIQPSTSLILSVTDVTGLCTPSSGAVCQGASSLKWDGDSA